MEFNNDLIKILNKKYDPNSIIELSYKRYDLSLKTDSNGYGILLFMGKRNQQGIVKGNRFGRTLKFKDDGTVLKDHWELKGKAT